jgi:hypothetical protein
VFPRTLENVIGIKFELLSSSGITSATTVLGLTCDELSKKNITTSFFLNNYYLLGWAKSYPVPASYADSVKNEPHQFPIPTMLETLSLGLITDGSSLTFGVGAYLNWQITFYHQYGESFFQLP